MVGLEVEGIAELLEAVPVAARGGVGRDAQQVANGIEGQGVPEFEDDDFALVDGELGERADGRKLGVGRFRVGFEPVFGFEFAAETPPEGSAVVQGAIAEGADQVEARFARGGIEGEQGPERIVQDILGFGMAEAEGASVEEEFGRGGIVEAFRPGRCVVSFRWHHGE